MSRLRVAFPLLGRGGWTGGYVYLTNTLRLIHSRLANEIEAHVFLSPAEHATYGAELSPLAGGRLIVGPGLDAAGRGKSLARALITGRDEPFERILLAAGIDVAFESASFYGARFAIPTVAWMPDFQHRHMPEMFTRLNWWRREAGFRMQIRAGRTVMLSSETARDDLERFYPAARGRGHVVRFAIGLDAAPYLARGGEMRARYGLPERFLFLPNQFWRAQEPWRDPLGAGSAKGGQPSRRGTAGHPHRPAQGPAQPGALRWPHGRGEGEGRREPLPLFGPRALRSCAVAQRRLPRHDQPLALRGLVDANRGG